MKKLHIAFILVAASIFSSCIKLDTKPEDFIAPPYYFNTEDDLDKSLNGVYNCLNERFLYSGAINGLITTFDASDEMFISNSNATTGPSVYNYSFTDEQPNGIWRLCHEAVEKANILLANVDKPEMDSTKRANIKGQAMFLRAYFQFVLVQNFGAIPLRLTPTASVNDIYNKRVPAKEVYESIYNQMVEAEKLVPENTAYTTAGRITKPAVQGILARVCLFMAGNPNNIPGKYQDALMWAEKVIDPTKGHRLNPDYSSVFVNLIQNKYDLPESIWEVEFFTTGNGEIYNNRGTLGITLGIRHTGDAFGRANPAYYVHDYFYKKYEDADLRRDWNIAPFTYANNTSYDKKYYTDAQTYNRTIGKYRREFEPASSKSAAYNGTNFPILRYSDVLLMAAEAENAINTNKDKAVAYINEVRRRAYGAGKTIKTIQVTNPGSGYPAAAQIQVLVNGGSPTNTAGLEPFSAVPVVSGGQITAIKIVTRGTFYNSTPTITIQSATGSGATAIVVMTTNADADVPDADKADGDKLLKFIQDERSRELCFESWRRVDLIRWGILQSRLKDELVPYIEANYPANLQYSAAAGRNVEAKHDLLPIPNWEFSANPETSQNKDW